MAKASVRVTKTSSKTTSKTVTRTRAKVKKNGSSKRGKNKCPVCGKFMGNGKS